MTLDDFESLLGIHTEVLRRNSSSDKHAAMAGADERYVYITADIAGSRVTIARRNTECDYVDAHLFDPDYTIAGSTGFLLWPGTWVLLELLRGGQPDAPQLSKLLHGKRVLELGAGTGLAGLCAAAAGAHVLMTDLPSVVDGILTGNVARNDATAQLSSSQAGPQPSASSDTATGTAHGPWPASTPIGREGGTATAMPIDWSEPLAAQLDAAASRRGLDASTADVLLACDVVWLQELLEPFRDTVVGLLKRCRPGTPFLLTFIDRAKSGSDQFSSRQQVTQLFQGVGCTISVYHTQMADVDGEQQRADVLEIKLPGTN